jgi:hypothetical protein
MATGKSLVWYFANIGFAICASSYFVYNGSIKDSKSTLSGWPALVFGLLVISVAAESIWSDRHFMRFGEPLSSKHWPFMFWLFNALLVAAGIRCAFLF